MQATCSVDALQIGAETALNERRAPEQKVGKCDSLRVNLCTSQ